MTQAVLSLSDANFYPAPVLFQLADFKQVQASVFQVARAPGKNLVYLGAVLLIVGVFAMLYIRERRLWVWLADGRRPRAPCRRAVHHPPHARRGRRVRALKRALLARPEPTLPHEHHHRPQTLTLGRPGLLAAGRSAYDWLFALLVAARRRLCLPALWRGSMDGYEKAILLGSVPALVALGWFWGPLRGLSLGVGAATLLAIALYNRTPTASAPTWPQADQVFLLKYFLSSQSAILWMSVLFCMSTVFYWIGFFGKAATPARQHRPAAGLASWPGPAWSWPWWALLVRWFESHQIAPDIGHIPVSNLYEVFVMFCWMTALFYLYFEQHYRTGARRLRDADRQCGGGLPGLVHGGARGARDPAAGAGAAELVDEAARAGQLHRLRHLRAGGDGGLCLPDQAPGRRDGAGGSWRRCGRWAWCCASSPSSSAQDKLSTSASYWALYFGVSVLIVGGILAPPAHRRPPAGVRGARRPDVQGHRGGLRLLHHRHHPGRLLGRRGLGRLLELGPEGDLGADRLAELRRLAAHAPDEGPARHGVGLVGAGRPGGHHLRLPGREHVPVGLHSYGEL
jgi:hypothetical protein